MNGFPLDLRHALRLAARQPGLSLIAIAALALGIGGNSALFSVVDGVLLRPLPFARPERLVAVTEASPRTPDGHSVAPANFADWKREAKGFSAMVALRPIAADLGGQSPERINAAVVSRDFFEVLGVRPLLGQTLAGPKGVAGGREVVISEGLWRRRFGADPEMAGRSITVDGAPALVRGVMRDCPLPAETELWAAPRHQIPEHPNRPNDDVSGDRGNHYLDVIGRLADGVTPAAAQAELAALAARIAAGIGPDGTEDSPGARVDPLQEAQVGNLAPVLYALFGAVGCILLIACANVANLILARALSQQHATAIRAALGATRGRLLQLFFAESLVLAVPGAALGLLLALWSLPPLAALAPAQLPASGLRLDGRVLGFTALVALGVTLGLSLVPAFGSAEPAAALQQAGRSTTGGRRTGRLRASLVVLEVGLSLVLLAGAGLLLRTLQRLEGVDPGFVAQGAVAADLSLSGQRYRTPALQQALLRGVLERLRATPGVEAAGVVSRLPLSGGNSARTAATGDRPIGSVDFRIASAGYFSALRIPLLAGRALADAEPAGVVVVNQLLASTAWPGQSPIGQRLSYGGDPLEVVGVVGDVRHARLDRPPRPELYAPLGSESWAAMSVVARGPAAPAALLASVREAVRAGDPDLALGRAQPMEARVARSLARQRFAALLLGLLAAVALVLATSGLYGVMSFSVAQRTRELGIRLALGASRGSVLAMVLRQALLLVGGGCALGLAGAVALSTLLPSLLFGVGAADPLVLSAVSLLLAGTALAGALIAARRAASVDPAIALRAE